MKSEYLSSVGCRTKPPSSLNLYDACFSMLSGSGEE